MYVLETGDPIFLLRFLPDGRRLLAGFQSGANEQTVRFEILALPGGEGVRLESPSLRIEPWWYQAKQGSAVAIHPDGERLYLAWGGRLYEFRTSDGAALPRPERVGAHQVVLAPDGKRLLAAYTGSDRKELTAMEPDADGETVLWRREMPPRFIHVAGFLPDGDRYVTVGDAVRVHAFADGAERAAARYPSYHAYQPQLSPDGRWLGVLGYKSSYFYDTAALGKPRLITSSRSSGDFVSLAFHPSGRTMAMIHGGPTLVRIYDAATLKKTQTFKWKLGALGAVAFSPDGLLGAAGSRDWRIVVWDVDE